MLTGPVTSSATVVIEEELSTVDPSHITGKKPRRSTGTVDSIEAKSEGTATLI
jgi:hypothetical protein